MPKKAELPQKKPSSRSWECPDCGQTIKHVFDGEEHIINRGHGKVTKCSGLFESVIVKCGACESSIEFTREELEEE